MKCPHCGGSHSDTAKFCEETSKPLEPQYQYCKNEDCDFRSPLPLSSKFCPNCGKPLSSFPDAKNRKRPESRITIITKKAGCEIYDDQYEKNVILPEGKTTLSSSRYPWLRTAFNINLGSEHIISIDLSNFDTSEFDSFSEMFSDCNNLESINLQNIDSTNVKDMSGMFKDCWNLRTINLNGLNTSQVTNLSNMFKGCRNLHCIDLSGLNTLHVNKMNSMLEDCVSLKVLKLNGFQISNKTALRNIFRCCFDLETIEAKGCDEYTLEAIRHCLDRDNARDRHKSYSVVDIIV